MSDSDLRSTDGLSPLVRVSPALMHIENLSRASLARSTRGVGVTDLREALEGRSSMSNPNLVNTAASLSTLDQTSIAHGGEAYKLTPVRSRPQRTKLAGPAEVKDVLNKLGIGKVNGAGMLRPPFASKKPEQRYVWLWEVPGVSKSDLFVAQNSFELGSTIQDVTLRVPLSPTAAPASTLHIIRGRRRTLHSHRSFTTLTPRFLAGLLDPVSQFQVSSHLCTSHVSRNLPSIFLILRYSDIQYPIYIISPIRGSFLHYAHSFNPSSPFSSVPPYLRTSDSVYIHMSLSRSLSPRQTKCHMHMPIDTGYRCLLADTIRRCDSSSRSFQNAISLCAFG